MTLAEARWNFAVAFRYGTAQQIAEALAALQAVSTPGAVDAMNNVKERDR